MPETHKLDNDVGLVEHREEREVYRNATDARQQFFALLTEVVDHPSTVVLIEHKDLAGRGMLVSETYRDYVDQLERLVESLAARLRPAGAFRLVGTMRLEGSEEDLERAIDELRASQRGLAAAKARDL